MDLLGEQIRKAHRDGAAIGEICQQLNVDRAAAVSALQNEIDFTDEDAAAAANVIKTIAKYGENERNKLNAATYIYDVKKGYRVNRNPTVGISAAEINILISQSNQDVNRFIEQFRAAPAREAVVVDGGEKQLQSPRADGTAPQNPSAGEGAVAADSVPNTPETPREV